MIEDTRKHLREDTEDLETNQQVAGVRCLFWCLSAKAWNGADFSDNKRVACNRVINQHCMSCCCKHWKDRNEKLRDEDAKRKRSIEWQKMSK